MQARIRTADFDLHFEGSPAIWNEFLRPVLGGPEALDEPDEPEPAPAPSAPPAAAPPTPSLAQFQRKAPHRPPPHDTRPQGDRPRHQPPARPEPQQDRPAAPPRRHERPQPTGPRIERTDDPSELYRRLSAVPGRRSEKDAVLAAVWFVSGGEGDVTVDEIERHLSRHGGPPLKVRPHLQKHVTRTKMLEPGPGPGVFRISRKGSRYVQDSLVGS